MQKIIPLKNSKLIIDYNETINLFLHTLNIYGLLGNHGSCYKLRNDERVKKSIDEVIQEDVKQGDSWFSYGNVRIYEPGMNFIIKNKTWEKPVDETNMYMGITTNNFGMAFKKCWDEFYKAYWQSTLNEREKQFNECVNRFDFEDAAQKMMRATHREFPSDVYIFPAEALGRAGLKFNKNICMGDIHSLEDVCFVHEGLHLLLNEEWAKNREIVELINKSNYKDKYYGSWTAKFEQVLVVGLDSCIRNIDDESAKRYYEGCNLHDVFDVAHPLIKSYYENGCDMSIEELMLKIIRGTVNHA